MNFFARNEEGGGSGRIQVPIGKRGSRICGAGCRRPREGCFGDGSLGRPEFVSQVLLTDLFQGIELAQPTVERKKE